MAGADTIAAIATAAGRGAIGIVRVSGPAAGAIAAGIVGQPLPARRACLTAFRDASGEAIDRGIALFFPGPGSYTGEDLLELQAHGGPLVLSLLLARCIELGARPAEPGEFTRRAFLNDKLDLAQAEAVADLIDASTQQAARSAARSLQGEFSRQVAALQERLIELRVLVEASFDFVEEDIDVLTEAGVAHKLDELQRNVQSLLSAAHQGRLLTSGLTVALVGPPNSGKSSLINALSKDEVAIVSPIPGTTRDLVRSTISIRGMPVHLVDTAGLRPTQDAVEVIGVERARTAAREADLVLAVEDASEPRRAVADAVRLAPSRTVYVHNKIDLMGVPPRHERIAGTDHVWVSAKRGDGLNLLTDVIATETLGETPGTDTISARQRHIDALRKVLGCVRAASQALRTSELAAEELRLAQTALSELTGEHVADDLLGAIFSRFCIGK
jgi:tRNA modification GTPase